MRDQVISAGTGSIAGQAGASPSAASKRARRPASRWTDDLADHVCQAHQAHIAPDRLRPDDPARPPADHAQFPGRRADRDGAGREAVMRARVSKGLAAEPNPLHRGAVDDPGPRPADRARDRVEAHGGDDRT